jgi:hypothetical protein
MAAEDQLADAQQWRDDIDRRINQLLQLRDDADLVISQLRLELDILTS